MSWSTEFRHRLNDTRLAPRYLLELFQFSGGPRGSAKIASFELPPYWDWMTRTPVSPMSVELGLRSWDVSLGSWTVKLTRDIGALREWVTRGTGVRLKVGFQGMKPAEFETVQLGVLRNISWDGDGFILQVGDILSALQARPVTSGDPRLFHSLSTTTVGTGGFSGSGTTLDVTSTAGFEKETTGAQRGLLRITGNSGNTFFLEWTGINSATQFAVVDANHMNTTREAASAGNLVEEVAYSRGSPIRHALRVLTSTGTDGANGSNDKLPAAWGLGIDHAMVDAADAMTFNALTKPSTGSSVTFLNELEPQDNPLAWLVGHLQQAGYFLAIRQGQITVRAALNPNNDVNPGTNAIGIAAINDDDIVRVLEYDAWDPATPVQYQKFAVRSGDGSRSTTTRSGGVDSAPAVQEYEADVSKIVHANETNWRTAIRDRLEDWYLEVPERIRLELAGWRRAGLAVGDVVELTTRRITGRWPSLDGFDRRRCVVTAHAVDWFRPRVEVQLHALPE